MTETTPRREATRVRLIDAAIDAFAERGIDATSVEQLCERADFTRGAFYSNFATKDDLCIAILEHQRSLMMSALTEAFQLPVDVSLEWALQEALPEFFRSLNPTSNARLTMLEIRLRSTRVPELRARLEEFEAETRPMMTRILTKILEGLGVRFRLELDQLVDVAEAIYLHQLLEVNDDDRLLKATITALVDDS